MTKYIAWFDQLTMNDVAQVGGKNASLGEMISHLAKAGVNVPAGFATTTDAYREFLNGNGLTERINRLLSELNVDDIQALAAAGKTIRGWVLNATLPDTILQAVSQAYEKLATSRLGRCLVCRTAGNTAQCAGIGSNHRRHQSSVCFVVQRPCDSVPCASKISARKGFFVRRNSENGSQRPRR